ncbi:unnamed protein product, partial [Nezara viridula]
MQQLPRKSCCILQIMRTQAESHNENEKRKMEKAVAKQKTSPANDRLPTTVPPRSSRMATTDTTYSSFLQPLNPSTIPETEEHSLLAETSPPPMFMLSIINETS